jgi:hypothetical protein
MRLVGIAAALAVLVAALALGASEAKADDSSVTVGFADPPPQARPIVVRTSEGDAFLAQDPEPYRAAVRFDLGPALVTTGRGLGYGVALGAAFGKGTVGFRASGTWLRGEAKSSDTPATMPQTGEAMGQYLGELTLDGNKKGPLHPVIAPGFGLVHVSMPGSSGNAGVGTLRLGLEYSLGLDDADVRLGGSVLGAMAGPRDDELRELRGYVVTQLGVTVGF